MSDVDLLIRAGTIYAMAPDRTTYRAMAIRGDRIAALSDDYNGLDGLAGAGTRVISRPEWTLLPAFCDNHNHLLEVAANSLLVPADRARSLAELVDLIRQRAAETPAGEWVQTSNGWHERNLAEGRLPTAAELDAATRDHPVLVRRGGHMAVANSLALKVSGITRETPNPRGGRIGRSANGNPDGMLEGGAQYVLVHPPALPIERQVASLGQVCRSFSASGIGTVRDAVATPPGVRLYRAALARDALTLRCRPMLLISPIGPVSDRIAQIDELGLQPGEGDDWVRLWGLKFVLDGGADGAALDQPYADDPTNSGHLNWEADDFLAVAEAAVRRGWRIGAHAVGDRAVRLALDVYEQVVAANPGLPAGHLAIEHAFLADGIERARAIRLGVAITVQPALLYGLGADLLRLWGTGRTDRVMPVKAWLDEGAELSAGSDYPISFYEPMRNLWAFITRQTEQAGIRGPEYAIDAYTAAYLYTAASARLNGEAGQLGSLQTGYLADVVAFPADPITSPANDTAGLRPTLTLVGGRATHDPEGLLA
jgi:predicted amidohydrolase YtcJ